MLARTASVAAFLRPLAQLVVLAVHTGARQRARRIVPGASFVENLHRYLVFDPTTSSAGTPAARSPTRCSHRACGRRRARRAPPHASRRASFDPPVEFEPPGRIRTGVNFGDSSRWCSRRFAERLGDGETFSRHSRTGRSSRRSCRRRSAGARCRRYSPASMLRSKRPIGLRPPSTCGKSDENMHTSAPAFLWSSPCPRADTASRGPAGARTRSASPFVAAAARSCGTLRAPIEPDASSPEPRRRPLRSHRRATSDNAAARHRSRACSRSASPATGSRGSRST